MKLQICTLFIFLISMVSVYGMEQNNYAELALQAKIYNRTHPLLCLPLELQQQLVFPCHTIVMQVTEDNVDELNEQIKTFFACSHVCEYFNKNLKLPWENLKLEKKNELLQCANLLLTKLVYKKYCAAGSVCLYRDEIAPQVYKKYRLIPLALVYSGAGADITYWTPEIASTTCLSKAVHAKDESAIAMLLAHGADPYQMSFNEAELAGSVLCNEYQLCYADVNLAICFRASTVTIARLFLEKIEKEKLLNNPKLKHVIFELIYGDYPLELIELWINYGINVRSIKKSRKANILHVCASLGFNRNESEEDTDKFLKKVELLLTIVPDMVNNKNSIGFTCIDILEDSHFGSELTDTAMVNEEKTIAVFRKYGGKSSRELEEEHKAQLIKQQENHENTKI